jgi:hypothetical protein
MPPGSYLAAKDDATRADVMHRRGRRDREELAFLWIRTLWRG